MKKRLQQFIESTGMSTRRFEMECGFPNAYVSNIKQTITPKRLSVLADHFPQLNVSWLVTGEGEMLRRAADASSVAASSAADTTTGATGAGAGAGDMTLERAIGIIDRLSEINLRYSEASHGQNRVTQQQNDIIMHLNRTIDRLADDAKEYNGEVSGRMERLLATLERSHEFVVAVMKELFYTWNMLAQHGVDVGAEQQSIGSVCLLTQRQIDEFVKE